MIAIEKVAISAVLAGAEACFYGQSTQGAETPLKPHETPENGAGVSAQTQYPCGFQATETPETPETCQKTEVEVKHAKKGQKWAPVM